MTKECAYYLSAWKKGNLLYDCYARPSWNKVRIWDAIQEQAAATDDSEKSVYTFGVRVLTYNCQVFTAGYIIRNDETDELTFVVHTPTRRMAFKVTWDDLA